METKTETPIMDFAPKAISTIIKCQNILAEYVVPDSGISDHDCINRLLEVLDNQDLVRQLRAITEDEKPKISTGITDKNGNEIFDGDELLLVYDTIRMKGVAKKMDDGDWCIYKDAGNYVGILHNQERISLIN